MPTPTAKPKRRLRLPRWSMKAMFVGVTVVCVLLGLVVRPAEQRKRAVAALRAIDGVWVKYDFEFEYLENYVPPPNGPLAVPRYGPVAVPVPESSMPGPAWLRDIIGIDYFADVTEVLSLYSSIRDDDLIQLRHFNELETLVLANCGNITDGGMAEVTRLNSLTRLNLGGSQITTLPPEIRRLSNLRDLALVGSQLTTLPPEIGRLSNLTALDLRDNRLTTLPPEIGELTDLEHLNISGNRFTTLPPEIGKLVRLTMLYVADVQLTALPPELGKLTELKTLAVEDNRLIALPPEIEKLTNLTDLKLTSNPITDADLKHLKPLKNLEWVFLGGTKVTRKGVAALKRALPNCYIESDF